MPTNLPPEYFDAEKRYKEAATPLEKASALEALISTIPKHKGTDKLRADLRRKLAQLREDAAKKKKAGKGDLYSVEKQGAAQVTLAGFANSGKSSLLKALTNAHPVIADYPVTTVMPLSGMMPFEDIQFQLVDLPPSGNESTDGWVSGIIRVADMVLLTIDLSDAPDIQTDLLLDQFDKWRIRLKKKTDVQGDAGAAKPAVIVANKSDLPSSEDGLRSITVRFGSLYPVVPVSCSSHQGLEELKAAVFRHAGIIRVYAKEPGKEADRSAPFVLKTGSTVLDLAAMIHKDFMHHLKYACIWGSAKFGGQRVQKDYVLHDKDVVEYHV